jgi:hypothetical protein
VSPVENIDLFQGKPAFFDTCQRKLLLSNWYKRAVDSLRKILVNLETKLTKRIASIVTSNSGKARIEVLPVIELSLWYGNPSLKSCGSSKKTSTCLCLHKNNNNTNKRATFLSAYLYLITSII